MLAGTACNTTELFHQSWYLGVWKVLVIQVKAANIDPDPGASWNEVLSQHHILCCLPCL